jgi:hypothetical protein
MERQAMQQRRIRRNRRRAASLGVLAMVIVLMGVPKHRLHPPPRLSAPAPPPWSVPAHPPSRPAWPRGSCPPRCPDRP